MRVTTAADHARRTRWLLAMDLQPYVLRAHTAQASNGTAASSSRCMVLVSPEAGSDPRQQALIRNVLAALHLAAAQTRQCIVAPDRPVDTSPAQAFLAFGEAQERILTAALPPAARTNTAIATTHDPQRLLREPLLKREVWQCIKALRKTLAAVPES